MKKHQLGNIKYLDEIFILPKLVNNEVSRQVDETDFLITNITGLKNINTPFKRNNFSLLIVINGACNFTVNYHEFSLKSKFISLISPNQIFSSAGQTSDFEAYMISFNQYFLLNGHLKNDIINELLVTNPEYPPCYELVDERQLKSVHSLYKGIENEINSRAPFFLNIVRLKIIELLYEYNRACEYCLYHFNKKMNRKFQIAFKFKSLVNENYIKIKTVAEYASLICISPNYLNEITQEELNISALEVIHNRILLEAKYLLKHSEYSIKEISQYLNFDNSSHFGRFFKLKTSITASEYRKSV